jgi:hypothetical protein
MKTSAIVALVAIVALLGGIVAWQAHERDENTLDISVGSGGIKVD